jgi:hypothetical protein
VSLNSKEYLDQNRLGISMFTEVSTHATIKISILARSPLCGALAINECVSYSGRFLSDNTVAPAYIRVFYLPDKNLDSASVVVGFFIC